MDAELKEFDFSSNVEPQDDTVLATSDAIGDSESHIFDNSSDLDLVNILYVNRIPLVSEAQKSVLDKVIADLTLWEAWEQTKIEDMVQQKVKIGQLPSDNTVDAKSKRTSYRSKIQQYLRRNAPWLGITKDVTESTSRVDPEKSINLAVLHMLLATSPLPKDTQFTALLKAIGPGFDSTNSMIQPYALTILDYNYDNALQSFRPELTTLAFDAKVEDVPKSKEPQRTATLNYTIQQATFNIDQWNRSKPTPESVTLGSSILPQRQLTLLQMP